MTAPEARADEDIHEQMRQIVLQIERTLKQVDDLLWDRRQARETVPVSVAARLGHARDGAKLAVEQMDKLLELAHEHPGSAGT